MSGSASARCLIPAGGRGSRLAPATGVVPKELLPVGTRPMLQWCIAEAIEAGFDEIGVVVGEGKDLVEAYLRDGRWREGLPPQARGGASIEPPAVFRQRHPRGVVDAVLSAPWSAEGRPFAVFLPDNVRLAGAPPLVAEHVARAAEEGLALAACHRVGPERAPYFGNVGRAGIEELAPAGAWPRVHSLQPRGEGRFRPAPEGSWRLLPRYVVAGGWLEVARETAAAAVRRDLEADDVDVHRALATAGRLAALPWDGTIVDAGNPRGYLLAQHLLFEAEERMHEERERARPGEGDLIQIGG